MTNVAILGCGPAGLMAAQAAETCGFIPIIFSNPVKSMLGGAQFLHMPISGMTDDRPDAFIKYHIQGTAEEYQRKVYGDDASVPFVSFTSVWEGKEQPAWNLIKTYDRLWEKFEGQIHPTSIDHLFVAALLRNEMFAHFFSTMPLISICGARAGVVNEVHHFQSQQIHIHTDDYIENIDDNTIIYNGSKDVSWYRASRIFGVNGVEWSDVGSPPIVRPLITDHKPIGTSCTCWPGLVRLGRRGTWTKGVLTHDAYLDVMKELG